MRINPCDCTNVLGTQWYHGDEDMEGLDEEYLAIVDTTGTVSDIVLMTF